MNRRSLIRMKDEEVRAFLEEQRTIQIATIDHDGWPHLVAMWYALHNEQIVFWTYAKSQKTLNLQRDPRLTCLVETGMTYDELRGVQVKGDAVIITEYDEVQQIGALIWERYVGSPLNENARQMVAAQAAKRVAVAVKPIEIVSWDHRKLGGGY